MSHVPHLSLIINLDPEKEPWCAGYAPSQGRRCHARTNAHGRSRAMELLDKGTESLLAGRHIDDLLGELAPHVLCQRFHQDQASTLTNRWSRQVSPFVKAPQSSPRRTIAQDPSTARRHVPIQTPVERQRYLLSEMERLMNELSSLEQNRHISAGSHDSGVIRDSQRAMRMARPMNNNLEATTPSDHASRENDYQRVIRLRPSRTRLISTRVPAAGQGSSTVASTSGRLPVAPPSNSGASSSPQRENHNNNAKLRLRSVNPVRSNSGVTRRPIQGDCGICLSSLENDIWEDTDNEDSDETEKEGSDGSEDDKSEWEDDDDDEECYSDAAESHRSNSSSWNGEAGSADREHHSIPSTERYDIVWCKAKCGVNYHRDCIDQWLASDPYKGSSCPTCRSTWES